MPPTSPPPLPLVVDDVGLPWVDLVRGQGPLSASALARLASIAQELEQVIPVAVTAGYLDLDRRGASVALHPEADQIVRLLADHTERLPIWNHGLTHRFGDEPTEFFVYGGHQAVPEALQEQHLALSQEIFEGLGLGRPSVFVPPAHGWQPEVTDRIAAGLGITHIAVRSYEKSPGLRWLVGRSPRYQQTWEPSRHLITLYRQGLGIPAQRTALTRRDLFTARIFTRPGPLRPLVHRTRQPQPAPHHFFAHIQNFERPSEGLWRELIILARRGLGRG